MIRRTFNVTLFSEPEAIGSNKIDVDAYRSKEYEVCEEEQNGEGKTNVQLL